MPTHKRTLSVNTPFDDVFRTIAEKMPELMIPLINEVFKTEYTEKDLLHQGRNEFTSETGRIITIKDGSITGERPGKGADYVPAKQFSNEDEEKSTPC